MYTHINDIRLCQSFIFMCTNYLGNYAFTDTIMPQDTCLCNSRNSIYLSISLILSYYIIMLYLNCFIY